MRLTAPKTREEGLAFSAMALMAVAFLLGGASRQNALAAAVIELTALPVLVLALLILLARPDIVSRHRLFLAVIVGAMLLPLLQLIPLPPDVWGALPGREQVRLALEVAQLDPPWLPVSFTPEETWKAFLFLIPPVAMALAVMILGRRLALNLVLMAIVAGMASILIGAMQLIGGVDFLRLWWSGGAPVTGLFANRNHLAVFLVMTMPCALVLAAQQTRAPRSGALGSWLLIAYLGLAVVALGVILSRAGILLLGPVLVFGLWAAWRASGRGRLPMSVVIGGGVVLLAVVAVSALALDPLMARFAGDDGRSQFWPPAIEAAQSLLPLGGGVGSFDTVYRAQEPLSLLDPQFFNHAHNDYLELWLEGGWLAVSLIVAGLVWLVRRSLTVWSAPGSRMALAQAASISLVAIVAHSFVDYPLRTLAIAVVFAALAGFLETDFTSS